MSDDVITAYMNAVDPSTGETRARTWGEAESAARRDVEAFEARGRLFRRNAGILQGKEGHVQAQVDNLLRQASLCDRTAQQRRGMAAAFASLADQAITAAEKSA